jgi:ABC-2 type transport system ATP-binding protein
MQGSHAFESETEATEARAVPRLVAARPVIAIAGLDKSFRSPLTLQRKPVLRGLDLEVFEGEVFGFLGLNGAGKTTTIRCLTGLARPSAGAVSLFGTDPRQPDVRKRIGYLPENPVFPEHLTPVEVLDLAGSLSGLSRPHRRRRIAELLTALRLESFTRTPLRKLSKGLVQRVGIAQAVVHEPELLILDETMSGLDPLGRRDVRDLIDNLRARGRTVFFSSHIVPDVEAICDRVGILNRGRLVAVGRIEELTTVRLHAVEVLIRNVPAELVARLLGSEDLLEERGPNVRVLVHDPARLDRLVVRVMQAGGRIEALERRRERLEDYFVRTAGEDAA